MAKHILYLHFWLALIALLLTMECVLFFSIPLEYYPFACFSASATLFTYNAHTLFAVHSKNKITELTNWASKHYAAVVCTCLIGLVLSLYICLQYFSLSQWVVLTGASCIWLLYETVIARIHTNGLAFIRNYSFLKSIILALVWTVITSILPLTTAKFNLLFQADTLLFICVRFCLFAFITQLFEYRDLHTEKNHLKKSNQSGKTIDYTNLTILCNLFALAICIQLVFLDLHVSFKLATILQLMFLIFFIRMKNITTVTLSMMIWDGILILSPLISIPFRYL